LIWSALGVLTLAAAIDVAVRDRSAGQTRSSGSSGEATVLAAGDGGSDAKASALIDRLKRAPMSAEVRGQPFAGSTWFPPRTTVPSEKRPTVPPFNYAYAGRMQVAGDGVRYYLSRGGEVFQVKVGDVLDGTYKVDGLKDDRIELTVVPEGRRLSMLFSSLIDTAVPEGAGAARVSDAGSSNQPSIGRALANGVKAQPSAQTEQGSASGGVAAVARSLARAAAAAGPAAVEQASSAASPLGTLGDAAPQSGSMPTGAAGPAGASMPLDAPPASGTMPKLPAPTGRLGS